MLAKMTSEVNMVNKFRLSRAVQMIDEKVQKLIDKQPNLVKNVTLYESNNGKFSF